MGANNIKDLKVYPKCYQMNIDIDIDIDIDISRYMGNEDRDGMRMKRKQCRWVTVR